MAELQSTKLHKCSECRSKECGLQLKCMHSFCLKCLQKMYNDDQTFNCTVCYAGANKSSSSKPRISVEHSILDASNVAHHVLIDDNFVVKLTTENYNCKAEYDEDLKITGKLTPLSVPGDEKDISVEDRRDGTYHLSGCCGVMGEWQLQCYVNDMQISQTPLKINVVKKGLQEHPDIFREKQDACVHMFDILDDTVYACGGVNEISKFTLKGELISTIYGHRFCQFTSLCCVNVAGDLSIVCYDDHKKKIMIYSKENWREFHVIRIESVPGRMISHDNKVYVPDYGKHCVLCFSNKGELLKKIEDRNYKNVNLTRPHGVAITPTGDMLVLSLGDEQVVKFDKDFKAEVFIENKGNENLFNKLWNYVYAIVVDERGQIIIGSYKKIQLFNKDGKFIKNIDEDKNLPDSPYSMFCRNRCLWVSDKTYSSLRFYYY